jgi:LCP family protein required for cell wall assembly
VPTLNDQVLLPWRPMASGSPPRDASDLPRRPRRSSPNQEGLLALGAQVEGEPAPADGSSGAPGAPPSGSGEAAPGNLADQAGTGGAGGKANEAGLLALGDQIQRSGSRRERRRAAKRSRSRTRKIVVRSAIALGVVIALVIGAVAGYAWWLNHEIHRVQVKDLTPAAAGSHTENILLVGSTDRCSLKTQNPAYGLCSQGITGINSDVVMILHLDYNTHAVSILSIPRDLFVPNARSTGANKIDAALVQGPNQLVDAIQEDFGIPIQHYVELNFDTFAGVVDALGGIKMYFPVPVYDAYSGLNIQTPGCVSLDGYHALQVVRARHLQYKSATTTSSNPANWPQEPESDLARIRRDHEFLRVLATAVSQKGLGNPVTDQQLIAAVAPQLTVDSSMSASHMVSLILSFHGANANTAPQYTLPVDVDQFGTYYYQGGGPYGDVEFPSNVQDQQVIQQFLGIGPTTSTWTNAPLPQPGSVSVSVLNGTGVTNQGATTSAALGALGFNMVGVGDAPPVGIVAETVVTYAQQSDVSAAEAVARSISGQVIMAMGPTTNGAQVTVTTGTDFTVNAPTPPTTTTTAPKGTTTTGKHPTTTTLAPTTSTTLGSIDNGKFTTPTASSEALQPWDPRSCTPSGGEGP